MNNHSPLTIYYGHIPSSLAGPLWIAVTEKGLYSIEFDKPEVDFIQIIKHRALQADIMRNDPLTASARHQVSDFLDGKRMVFDLEVDLRGLPAFQQAALKATLTIPYGQTATYAEVAAAIGHPGAARAVGRAEATNPIPHVIPCHRVVGSDGKLHGYGGPGGIRLKAKLLELEQSHRKSGN